MNEVMEYQSGSYKTHSKAELNNHSFTVEEIKEIKLEENDEGDLQLKLGIIKRNTLFWIRFSLTMMKEGEVKELFEQKLGRDV